MRAKCPKGLPPQDTSHSETILARTAGFLKTIARIGEAAKLPFAIHPHTLRHSTGCKLANDGHDTRALQHYMGHKNIMHTVRYTDMAPDRFKNFWQD